MAAGFCYEIARKAGEIKWLRIASIVESFFRIRAIPSLQTRLRGEPGLIRIRQSQRPNADRTRPGLPTKDRPVLAAAIQHRCDLLFTGDAVRSGTFFGQTIGGVVIHSPAGLAIHLETL